MKTEAIVLREHGGPEVLRREIVDLPEPAAREVRIRVRAVALNHLDLWVRRGLPNLRLEYPHRLGSDVAGEVDALGPGARGVAIGDKVVVNPGVSCGICVRCLSGEDTLCPRYGILGEDLPGGYGRHTIVPDANLVACPGHLPFTQAAAVPLVFLTAWEMVVEKARVRQGETVLVHAAGSGVGTAGVQIARAIGARTVGTARTSQKIERAVSLGLSVAIVVAGPTFAGDVLACTHGQGVEVVLDLVGGPYVAEDLACLAPRGRIMVVGTMGGPNVQLDLALLMTKRAILRGTVLRSRPLEEKILAGRALERHIVPLLASGALRPIVDSVLPLAEAAEAHRRMQANGTFGKVVLEV